MAIVGPNGAGKTTMLKAIMGLLKPVAGMVSIHGRPAVDQKRITAYVPQRNSVDWDFPVTVLDVVRMGRLARKGEKTEVRTEWIQTAMRSSRRSAMC
jgi:manganese/zinc/iron transport system ATP- binding protein